MNISLDRIESLLRQWFEGWAESSGEDFRYRFLQELERVLPEIFTNPSMDFADEQNIILTIGVSPTIKAHLQDRSTALNELMHTLQQVSKEQGVPVHFSVELAEDSRLKSTEVWIDWEIPSDGNSTRAMPNPLLEQTGNARKRAYLIVPGGELFPLEKSVVNIGRMKDNHLVLDDPRVSRHHVQIRRSPEGFVLFDLNSTGGTMVNHLPVHQWVLRPGDVISLAGVTLVYGEDEQTISGEDTADTATMPKGNE